jgi:large subunit ribosomal protein L28e
MAAVDSVQCFSRKKRNSPSGGLANNKTVSITPATGEDLAVVVATTKTKKQHKPADSIHRSVLKNEFRKMAKHVANQVDENYYRRDLKKPALARLSVVHKSLCVAKAGEKNHQKGKRLLGNERES